MVEEFSVDYALELAEEYDDVENTTRLCIEIGNYGKIYSLMKKQLEINFSASVQQSMDWIVKDYMQRLRSRINNEPFTFKLQIFDIYQGVYDEEIEKLLNKYPKLRLIFNMRRAEFDCVHNQCTDLRNKEDNNEIKPLLAAIGEVNNITV